VDLRYSEPSITEGDISEVCKVLRSKDITQGNAVPAFEDALAEYVGSKYAVAVSSGTAALHLAIELVAPHDQPVITSPISFVATANAIILAGHEPDFRDIDPATGNMRMDDLPLGCTALPVHYAGRAVDLSGLVKPKAIVEDACHALGALEYGGDKRVGACTYSQATVFSFHAVKPITTGEGGAVTTNDEGLAVLLRSLRSHGRDINGNCQMLGYNYRMTDIQAALGLSQLRRCDDGQARRHRLALKYDSSLVATGRASNCPTASAALWIPEWSMFSSWHLYPIRIKNGRRDEVRAKLNASGIGATVHYPSIPSLPYYRALGFDPKDFPGAESFAKETLSLPLHSGMISSDVDRVVKALLEALSG
jgi:dTDP-4-amino-4,6-dideoxygalactose transaminase